MNQKEKFAIIGSYCKVVRMDKLGMTVKEFARITGKEAMTILEFENGRSTNITPLFKYLDFCATPDDRIKFLKGLNKILGVDK